MERNLRFCLSPGSMGGRSTHPLSPGSRLSADECECGDEGLTGSAVLGALHFEVRENHLGGGRGERND